MSYGAVTVTTSATEVVPSNAKRHSLIIANNGDSTIYLGPDSSVTVDNGIPLHSGTLWEVDSGGTKLWMGPFFGIVSTGTQEARYWERER